MIGILSYGAYIPPTRLPLSVIAGGEASEDGPERAVAWHDEDAVTLGVTAGVHCLAGFDRSRVDALFFASTTLPFQEKQAAALAARVLDLPREIWSADHTGSTRAATSALRAAFDAVRAGSARCVLVIASDVRLAAPGSGLESRFGDAAAAFLVGEGAVLATLEGAAARSDEVTDLWRPAGDPFVHTWEDRFVIQESFTPNLLAVVRQLLEGSKTEIGDYEHVALSAPDARSHAAVAKTLGVAKSSLRSPLFGRVGDAGAAFAPLQLVEALEAAGPGDRILLANFGNGADALAFCTTQAIAKAPERRGVAWHLPRRRTIARYDDYLAARGFVATEWDAGTNPGLSATILFRERDDDLSLLGQRCRRCQAVQFPAQRVCESCFAKDEFETLRLSDRVARVVTYTFDHFFPTPDPPTVVTIVDVEGARLHLQLIEIAPDDVRLGLAVEFVFRRIHQAGGRPNYYWKGIPKPD